MHWRRKYYFSRIARVASHALVVLLYFTACFFSCRRSWINLVKEGPRACQKYEHNHLLPTPSQLTIIHEILEVYLIKLPGPWQDQRSRNKGSHHVPWDVRQSGLQAESRMQATHTDSNSRTMACQIVGTRMTFALQKCIAVFSGL